MSRSRATTVGAELVRVGHWRKLLEVAAIVALAGCGSSTAAMPGAPPLRIGALFPLTGPLAPLAREEYAGVTIAGDFANADGGVHGRKVELDVRDLTAAADADRVVSEVSNAGEPLAIGAYSSGLSMSASSAAATHGIGYWEAGAVADQVTGRGLPGVFRVGATGNTLGENSGRFSVEQLAPRLGKTAEQLRVAVVAVGNDLYGQSVADAAEASARHAGAQIVSRTGYDGYRPDWPPVLRTVAAATPDVLILASHIPDGVSFRRAMLAAHLHVGALVGTTMAECGPEFGALLGTDAIGVFASDRPTSGFNPQALGPVGRADYARFAAAWRSAHGGAAPTEEGLSGFAAAWALFHYVLPRASRLDVGGISAAAFSTTLPQGTLPNGAGLRFATDAAQRGQNLDASAVVWQWQGVRHSVTVWPTVYATGTIGFVPLPR